MNHKEFQGALPMEEMGARDKTAPEEGKNRKRHLLDSKTERKRLSLKSWRRVGQS